MKGGSLGGVGLQAGFGVGGLGLGEGRGGAFPVASAHHQPHPTRSPLTLPPWLPCSTLHLQLQLHLPARWPPIRQPTTTNGALLTPAASAPPTPTPSSSGLRPHDIDDAMHRRITMAFEFRRPDHVQRLQVRKRGVQKGGEARRWGWGGSEVQCSAVQRSAAYGAGCLGAVATSGAAAPPACLA